MNVPWELIDAFLDDELSPGQEAELRDWLLADREHVRVFVRATHLHRSLRTEMLAQKILPEERALSRTHDEEFDEEPGGVPNLSPSPATRVDTPTEPRDVVPFPQSHGGRFSRARGAVFALAASIALLIGLSVWLFPLTNNEPTLALAPGTRVTLERNGQSFPAQDGLKLLPDDLLRISGSNGAAISYGKENTRVVLKDDMELKTLAWQNGKRFELRQGKLEVVVARQRRFGPMVIVTPQAEARVLGTRFTLDARTNETRLEVSEGKVKLTRTSDGVAVKVVAGYHTVAANGVELAALPRTGQILREIWRNIPGNSWMHLITHTNYPDRPDDWGYLTNFASFEMPSDWADNYGVRLRGYIHPPETRDYTFWIAAKDDASLWLSPDEDPENKVQMAHSQGAALRDWQRSASQQSATVPLTAGKRYYFEVLHKAGVGDDHLAVAWQRPGVAREVIPGEYLSPFPLKEKKRKR